MNRIENILLTLAVAAALLLASTANADPNGTTRIRKGKDGKTVTRRPDGIHLIHDNKKFAVTVTHPSGKRVKLTNKELIDLYKNDKGPADLVRPSK